MIMLANVSSAAGEDFEDTSEDLVFSEINQTRCFNVSIINDNDYELREDFFINLTTTVSSVTLNPRFVTISINDEDGE